MIKITIPIVKANGPHNGRSTNHHDQSMTLHNLRTINAIVNKPKKLIPPSVLFIYDL